MSAEKIYNTQYNNYEIQLINKVNYNCLTLLIAENSHFPKKYYFIERTLSQLSNIMKINSLSEAFNILEIYLEIKNFIIIPSKDNVNSLRIIFNLSNEIDISSISINFSLKPLPKQLYKKYSIKDFQLNTNEKLFTNTPKPDIDPNIEIPFQNNLTEFRNPSNLISNILDNQDLSNLIGKKTARSEKIENLIDNEDSNSTQLQQIRLNFLNGKGKYNILENGCKYEGDFVNGLFEGKGILTDSSGNKIYEGDFKKNLFDGNGVFHIKNNCIYEGQFRNNYREGWGKLIVNKTTIYNGMWRNGVKEGYGILYYENGDKFSGFFKEGQILKENGVLYNKNKKIIYMGKEFNKELENKGEKELRSFENKFKEENYAEGKKFSWICGNFCVIQ